MTVNRAMRVVLKSWLKGICGKFHNWSVTLSTHAESWKLLLAALTLIWAVVKFLPSYQQSVQSQRFGNLFELVDDLDGKVAARINTAILLRDFDDFPSTVPILVNLLRDDDFQVRRAAADSIVWAVMRSNEGETQALSLVSHLEQNWADIYAKAAATMREANRIVAEDGTEKNNDLKDAAAHHRLVAIHHRQNSTEEAFDDSLNVDYASWETSASQFARRLVVQRDMIAACFVQALQKPNVEKSARTLLAKDGERRLPLYYLSLSGLDLSGLNLSRADLRSTSLYDCNLRNADLSEADLTNAFWTSIDFEGTDMSNVRFNHHTTFIGVRGTPKAVPEGLKQQMSADIGTTEVGAEGSSLAAPPQTPQ